MSCAQKFRFAIPHFHADLQKVYARGGTREIAQRFQSRRDRLARVAGDGGNFSGTDSAVREPGCGRSFARYGGMGFGRSHSVWPDLRRL